MHFAALLNIPDSVRDPSSYYQNNVAGTLATLEAMTAEGCRQFVFSSTCAVYGEPTEIPIAETHPTRRSTHGQTKPAIEHALPHFERAYGIRSIRLRHFNAAGADPEGELGEDHTPEVHAIPRAFDAMTRTAIRDLRRRLSNAGRDMPSRLRARNGPRGCSCACPAAAGTGGGVRDIQRRDGAAFVRTRRAGRRRADQRQVTLHRVAPRRAEIRRCLRGGSAYSE